MNMRLAAGLALVVASSTVAPTAAVAQSLAFSPVTVIDVREGVARSGMTVIVTGNRVELMSMDMPRRRSAPRRK